MGASMLGGRPKWKSAGQTSHHSEIRGLSGHNVPEAGGWGGIVNDEHGGDDDWVARIADTSAPSATPSPSAAIPSRHCHECGRAADHAHLNQDGTFDAWYCHACDQKRRQKRMGWRRRTKRRLRRTLLR
jgi:hypothetical protein